MNLDALRLSSLQYLFIFCWRFLPDNTKKNNKALTLRPASTSRNKTSKNGSRGAALIILTLFRGGKIVDGGNALAIFMDDFGIGMEKSKIFLG